MQGCKHPKLGTVPEKLRIFKYIVSRSAFLPRYALEQSLAKMGLNEIEKRELAHELHKQSILLLPGNSNVSCPCAFLGRSGV